MLGKTAVFLSKFGLGFGFYSLSRSFYFGFERNFKNEIKFPRNFLCKVLFYLTQYIPSQNGRQGQQCTFPMNLSRSFAKVANQTNL